MGALLQGRLRNVLRSRLRLSALCRRVSVFSSTTSTVAYRVRGLSRGADWFQLLHSACRRTTVLAFSIVCLNVPRSMLNLKHPFKQQETMRRAIIFSGQGSLRSGIKITSLDRPGSPAWSAWKQAQDTIRDRFGWDLISVVRDNPAAMAVNGRMTTFGPSVAGGGDRSDPNYGMQSVAPGALTVTSFAQPAVLAVQLTAYLEYCDRQRELAGSDERRAACFAGHSLGEYSALCALGVLPLPAAAVLVHERGNIMLDLAKDWNHRQPPMMVAVLPQKAMLTTDEALAYVAAVAEARAAVPGALLEVVNYNGDAQFVVAGDPVSLAAFGKCLDPQWRATVTQDLPTTETAATSSSDPLLPNTEEVASITAADLASHAVLLTDLDIKSGVVPADANAPDPIPLVHSTKQRTRDGRYVRPLTSLDDGRTLTPDKLGALSGEGDGRSGLKKKSYFMPLMGVSVPFHSSPLCRGMTRLHALLLDALPAHGQIESLLQSPDGPRLVTNLTGTVFDAAPSSRFRDEAAQAVRARHVGEIAHPGCTQPLEAIPHLLRDVEAGDARQLLAAVMASQLTKPVRWTDVMRTLVDNQHVREVVEFAPTKTLGDMFLRTSFTTVTSPKSELKLLHFSGTEPTVVASPPGANSIHHADPAAVSGQGVTALRVGSRRVT